MLANSFVFVNLSKLDLQVTFSQTVGHRLLRSSSCPHMMFLSMKLNLDREI